MWNQPENGIRIEQEEAEEAEAEGIASVSAARRLHHQGETFVRCASSRKSAPDLLHAVQDAILIDNMQFPKDYAHSERQWQK